MGFDVFDVFFDVYATLVSLYFINCQAQTERTFMLENIVLLP